MASEEDGAWKLRVWGFELETWGFQTASLCARERERERELKVCGASGLFRRCLSSGEQQTLL